MSTAATLPAAAGHVPGAAAHGGLPGAAGGRLGGPILTVAVAAAAAVAAIGETAEMTRIEAGVAAFQHCVWSPTIALSPAQGTVTLAPAEYLVHTVGNRLAGKLRVGGKTLAKKTFVLDRVQASGAELFVFQGRGKGTFNGEPIVCGPFVNAGGWSRAEIPGPLLRRGVNEVVFRSGLRLAQDA